MPRRAAVLSLTLALFALAATTANAAAAAPEAPPAVTLEQVMSAPFASLLTAAPAGGRLAWVLKERGARNVWVAAPPDYHGRRLTPYTADDGQEISDLAWTPDGRTLLYVRGGEANRHGEHPNPKSDPAGTEQAIYAVSADAANPANPGAPQRLGEGSGPAVSPRGDQVVFVRGEQVWTAPLAGVLAGKAAPVQLVHARGTAMNLRWSPDGGRLAFVSDRGNHAFVGVYDLAAKSLSYLDPSVDKDLEPVWSPDGRSLAFLRLPTTPAALPFIPQRSGPAWSIRVADLADLATGRSRQVFRSREGKGSVFRGIASRDQLLWSANGSDTRLVFPSEADGWLHLYAVPAAGGEAVLLTPGAFEVENATLAASRREVLYAGNQDDSERRHLFRVAAAGGTPAALTPGEGIEWAPVETSDGKLACFHADARRSGRPALLAPPGGTGGTGGAAFRDLAPEALPADFPADRLVTPQAVRFPAADGLTIHGQLFLPPGVARSERRPAVVFFHGGPERQMLLGWHYMEYYHNSYAFNQFLASRGFVVLAVNYRSGIGYGMEFREALGYGANGASEWNDVQGAGLYLRGRADVDPTRIGLWGGSYGGYLTALGLARASDLFAAGVDFHGVHDWNVVIGNFAPGYDPAARAEVARLAFASSPMAAVKGWRSPVLLIHGDDDRNVPFSETVNLVAALREQGVEPEQLIFPDEIHDLLLHANWLRGYRAAAEFLERRLGGGRP
ncbi:MAG TPA: prolyl oligopeptidase family serine peptidase [Thermoanaerobaculia bacterium]|nr:prolyl oligopeptidase family serine peptidase [Thermoanaerobaculia bacterium]